MYSLSISFGPTGTVWQFLFKEKEKAEAAWKAAYQAVEGVQTVDIKDDFGQAAAISDAKGCLLEDLDLVEAARIQRSLADERTKAKFIKAATDDPIIKAAMRPQGPGVLTPMGGFRQN